MNAFLDTGFSSESWKERAHIGSLDQLAPERAEDGLTFSKTQHQPPIQPALNNPGCQFIESDSTSAISLPVKNSGGPGL
jgi:hypothetical protein